MNVDFTLDHTGTRHYFDVILDESSISQGKRNPEIYLKAAKAIRVEVPPCVVFEDSISGIQAGIDAGAKVVGLATTHPEEMLTGVDMIIKNYNKLTIKRLSSLFKI